MTDVAEKSDVVSISASAAENIRALLSERELTDHYLRVYVAGIGCAGPEYGLAFDKEPREDDVTVEAGDVHVVIDPNSLIYLQGATIDYVDTPQGKGFKIDNPNPLAAAACGSCAGSCG